MMDGREMTLFLRFQRALRRPLRDIGFATFAVVMLASGGCSEAPPPGDPIDFEELSKFKPFELKTVEGETSRLSDHLGKATLVSFFFPT